MYECLITFRSVMPAQRMEALLQRRGIGCTVRRTPKWMEVQGCGYALQIWTEEPELPVQLLKNHKIPMRRLYIRNQEGELEEMPL